MVEPSICRFCGLASPRKFIGDMSIRPPGLQYIGSSPAVLSPEFFVCLNCGMGEFAVSEDALRLLLQFDGGDAYGLESDLCRRV
jgi:hypothetical protein